MREITVTTERRAQLIDVTRQVREALNGSTGPAVLVYVPRMRSVYVSVLQ